MRKNSGSNFIKIENVAADCKEIKSLSAPEWTGIANADPIAQLVFLFLLIRRLAYPLLCQSLYPSILNIKYSCENQYLISQTVSAEVEPFYSNREQRDVEQSLGGDRIKGPPQA